MEIDTSIIRYGLNHCYIGRDRYVKQDLAVELETLASFLDDKIEPEKKATLHESLRSYLNRFTNNIFQTKDYTYKKLQNIRNLGLCVINGDKDSSITIIKESDYKGKLDQEINTGIADGTYEITEDRTHEDLTNFQQFLYRNFKNSPVYNKLWPDSNQPGRAFLTAKTHKFENFTDISLENLKFRMIVDQTGTFANKASRFLNEYLKPLVDTRFIINNTLDFPEMLKNLPPKKEGEEDVSFDVEKLFTSIPLKRTIDYIVEQIYTHKKIEPIVKSKLIFERLLYRLTNGSTFQANGRLIRQIDGCAIGCTLSVTLRHNA